MSDNTGRDLVEKRSLGWGLAVEPVAESDYTRVDIAFSRDGAAALKRIDGQQALRQDLTLAFCTGRGTDPLNVDFGFDGPRLVAEEDDRALLRERLRAAAAVVCDRDPRIRKVLDVQLRAVSAEAVVAEKNGPLRVLEITVRFETALGKPFDMTFIPGGSDA